MTLTTTTNRKDYTGNGAILIFAYDFLIPANADLGVYLDGVKKTLTTDYTVSGAGVPTGGNVTFIVAPGSGVAVSIIREVAYTQSVDYVENQKFPADTHESALDRVTMLCQQLLEKVGRAATFKIQSLLTNPILPDGVAGKFLRWKTTAEIENVDVLNVADPTTTRGDMLARGASVMQRLAVGTNKQVLQSSGIDPAWASLVTAKGDVLVGDATGLLARKAIGTDRQSLKADSGQSDGLRWADDLVFNVKDYGAKGDGVTDDTTAIQNAINAVPSNGGIVFFPPGTYKTTATITLGQKIILQGSGLRSSIIAPTAAVTTDTFSYQPVSLTTSALTIADLGFSGNATTLRAIHLKNLTSVNIKRVYVDGFTNTLAEQVLFENVQSSEIRNSMFLNTTTNGIRLTSTSHNNQIVSNAITSTVAGGIGITIDAGIVGTLVAGNDFEGTSAANIGLACNGTIATMIVANFFEFWTGAAIAANSGAASNLQITGNHIHATSAAAAAVALNSAGPNDRVTAENNYLALLGNAGTTTIGFLFGNTTQIWARGNKSGGSGTGIVSVGGVTQTQADYMVFRGRPIQSLAFSATLTVDSSAGEHIIPGSLTANITIAAPTNGAAGQELTFNFTQDATGGRTVTWNAVFIRVSWSDAGNVANTRSSICFVCLDGTNWLQVGAQKGWS